MATKYKQKFPRLKFTVKDADGVVVGDVVAKDLPNATVRAEATYPDAKKPLDVQQTGYGSEEQ